MDMYTIENPRPLPLSVNLANRKLGSVTLPREIESVIQLITSTRTRTRRPREELTQIYKDNKEFLNNFDEKTEEWIQEIELDELTQEELQETIDKVRERHQDTENMLVKVKKEAMKENLSPQIYFMAQKHYTLTQILLDKVEEHNEEINLDEISEKIKEDEKVQEIFKLGVFIAAEPELVTSLVVAEYKKDNEFVNKYSDLLEKFGFMVARTFRKEYNKKTELEKFELNKEIKSSLAKSRGF